MVLYKSCGILGFGNQELTDAEFKASNYSLNGVYSNCGILGFFSTPASYDHLPPKWNKCGPEHSTGGVIYTLGPDGACKGSCESGKVRQANSHSCVAPGEPCHGSNAAVAYAWTSTGTCAQSPCPAGKVTLPLYSAGELNATECPIGYSPIKTRAECSKVSSMSSLSTMKNLSSFKDDSFETTQPPGCFVFPADGKFQGKTVDKSILFNESKKGVANTNSFVLCKRTIDKPCGAKVGDMCLTKSYPNYTWRKDETCAGTCLVHSCLDSQRCCSGTCYEDSALANGRCPHYAKTENDIKKLGSTIDGVVTHGL